jgi:hypothetical protein
MNCPKCGGGAFLGEEDLVKVMDNMQPMKLLIKQTFVCRACSERFSRIVWDDFEARKRTEEGAGAVETVSLTGNDQQASSSSPDQAAAGIQFLDNV